MFKKSAQRSISVLLAFVIAFSGLLLPSMRVAASSYESEDQIYEDIWDGKIASGFDSGSGSENDPYIIRTGAQLAYLAQQTNIGISYDKKYFELLNDIDLNNIPWTPIGNSAYNNNKREYDDRIELLDNVTKGNHFSGNFNGNGNTIKNLKYSSDYDKSHLGFFDMCDGNISNLSIVVSKISIESNNTYKTVKRFGGVVAVQYGGMIDNCSFEGDIVSELFSCYAIVSVAKDTIVQNCSFRGNYTSQSKSGGMIGTTFNIIVRNCENFAEMSGYAVCGIISSINDGGTIENCSNYGDLIATDRATGIVGNLLPWDEDVSIYNVINCKNYGNCIGYGYNAGGIVNYTSTDIKLTMSYCENYGDIYGKYDTAGILCRYIYGDQGFVNKCFNYGKITSTSYCAGGICSQGKSVLTIQDCYNMGDIEMTPGNQYYGSGGILGGWHPAYKYSEDIPTVKNCYNTGKIITDKKSAAICASKYCRGSNCYYLDNNSRGVYSTADFEATKLTEEEMKFASSFKDFDFVNVWCIDSLINNGYPYLKDAPPSKVIDTSFIDYSKSKSRLKYPIYNKEKFAKLLKSWVESSQLSNAFSVYLNNGYTYEDLLDLTIDLPVLSNGGDGYSIKGETSVKDLMAYLLFADNVKKFISDVEFNVKSKMYAGKSIDAYSYFYEQLIDFNLQYNYFQLELNGKDTFNQTLMALLIAKTAMECIEEVEITYKSGEKKYLVFGSDEYNDTVVNLNVDDIQSNISFKSYTYITDLYKTSVNESYKNYDDLQYYVFSGGDTKYLNKTYQEVLDGYSNIIKNCKFLINDDKGVGSVIDIGIDNIEYFTKRTNSEYYEQVKKAKEIWDNGKKGYNLIKSIATYSPFGVINTTFTITKDYIEKIKAIYEEVEKSEFGWYALTYYYLEGNNPQLLNAIIDPKTGSAEFGIDRVAMNGIPYNSNDIVQTNIVKHWNNTSYLEYTYTPDEDERLHMLNSCNTLNRINDIDTVAYSNALLEYIVADLGLEHNIADQYARVTVLSNNETLGTVTKTTEGTNTVVYAIANEGVSFVGWYDTNTGIRVSSDPTYKINSLENITLQAKFLNVSNVTAAADAEIFSQSSDIEVPLGVTSEALFVNVFSPDNGSVTIEWYKNNINSNQGGVLVGYGSTFVPPTDVMGTVYYYASIKNTLVDNGITTTSVKKSVPNSFTVTAPIVTGIKVLQGPNKTLYLPGEEFSSDGLLVCLEFSDNTTSTITDYNLICESLDTVGLKKVTINCLGFSQQFTVEVAIRKEGSLSEEILWDLDLLTGQLVISGVGSIPTTANREFLPYRQFITSLVIEEGISSILPYAFSNLTNLKKVILSESVLVIDRFAFGYCTALTQVTLPENLTSIGERAFYGCTNLKQINIPYSVISIGGYAFYNCISLEEVYYADTQEQWAKIAISENNTYLENAVRCIDKLSFKGASLTLHHNLAINYKVDKALFDTVGYTNPYVVFEIGGKTTTVKAYAVEGERYVFRFRNIAPNQMNDTIYATLYATYNGVEYASETKEYSVAEYCYSTLNKYSADEYAELRTLLVDLLHYGAQSQLYTNYNTENLVDANLTETQLAWGTTEDPTLTNSLNTEYETVENPLITWKGASLNLNDSVSMRFKFIAEDIDGLSLKITSETDEWNIKSNNFVLEDGVYSVRFSGLNAGQMSEKVYLTMYKDGVAVSNTVCYSIESYAYSKQDSTIEHLSDLVKAMMKYGNSAYSYVN